MTNIDEIERLRADLFTARCEAEDMSGEIERLRAAIATWERACASYVNVLAARDAEIERLRKYTDGVRCAACDMTRLELGEARAEIDRLRGDNEQLRIVVEEQAREVQRLRGLLREIVDQSRMVDMYHWDNNLYERVREALGE